MTGKDLLLPEPESTKTSKEEWKSNDKAGDLSKQQEGLKN